MKKHEASIDGKKWNAVRITEELSLLRLMLQDVVVEGSLLDTGERLGVIERVKPRIVLDTQEECHLFFGNIHRRPM